jgi:hypothetical protein
MLGQKVLWGYGNSDNRTEGMGIIVDKVRMTDIVRNSETKEVIGVSAHDIYIIKEDDGNIISMNPNNVIKVL